VNNSAADIFDQLFCVCWESCMGGNSVQCWVKCFKYDRRHHQSTTPLLARNCSHRMHRAESWGPHYRRPVTIRKWWQSLAPDAVSCRRSQRLGYFEVSNHWVPHCWWMNTEVRVWVSSHSRFIDILPRAMATSYWTSWLLMEAGSTILFLKIIEHGLATCYMVKPGRS
jgi:hypothetical protein